MNIDSMSRPRLLFVTTYPPTRCGIANFSQSLLTAVSELPGKPAHVGVFRLLPEGDESVCAEPGVATEVTPGSPNWLDDLVDSAQSYDLLWVQHEFGIFGPQDGHSVIDLFDASPLPIVTSFHTVLERPTTSQRRIVEEVFARSEAVVVLSRVARTQLLDGYAATEPKVEVIPHGALALPRNDEVAHHPRRPTIVTWGLVGPGKGIEWSIRAMANLRHLDPLPRLMIRGATHPKVKDREGESYRRQCEDLIRRLGVEDMVQMEDGYLSVADLHSLLHRADLALLPYDTTQQVTSGVLSEAVAAGLPVVATAFPHAIDLLSGGAGSIVPQRDPEAIARAVERYLTAPSALRKSARIARDLAKTISWPAVAVAHTDLACHVLARRLMTVA